VVLPETFKSYIEHLNVLGRKKVTLLKDRDLMISDEADQLLKEIKEDDLMFLHRSLTRLREEGAARRQVSPQAQLP